MKDAIICSRRQILRDIGLGGVVGAALPYLPLLEGDAHAAGAAPRRLLLVIHGNGTNKPTDSFFPKGQGLDLSTSPVLSTIKDLQSKVTVIDGLNHKLYNDGATGGTAGLGHVRAMGQVLTGMPLMGGGSRPSIIGGISVDQFLANKIEEQAKAAEQPPPAFKSIGSAVGDYIAALQSAGPNQRVAPTVDPNVQYERLFAGLAPPSTADTLAAGAGFKKRQAERNAVFDFVGRRLQAISNVVGTADRRKVEAHFDHLSDLRSRLSRLTGPTAGCPNGAIEGEGANEYAQKLDAHGRIIARAFACDLTRTAVLAVFDFPGRLWGVKENEHYIAHYGNAPSKHAGYDQLSVKIETFRMELLGKIMRHMDGIPDGAGTLLDNTMVVIGSDMGGGAHQSTRVPTIIVGGGGGALKTGRKIMAPDVPWNNFLVSLCQLMGHPVEKFGHPSICTGAVPGLA